MAQPDAARAAANARVGTIQKWLVGIAIGCVALSLIAFVAAIHQPHRAPFVPWPTSHWILMGIAQLFGGLSLLGIYVGRGLLMLLWPRDVEGELRSAAERTGRPRLYGLALMSAGIAFVLALGLLEVQSAQTALLDSSAVTGAIVGLWVMGLLPVGVLEVYGGWRRHVSHRTP